MFKLALCQIKGSFDKKGSVPIYEVDGRVIWWH